LIGWTTSMFRRRSSWASFHTPSGRSPAASGRTSTGIARSCSRSTSSLVSSPSEQKYGR
jgi:hypothetical protein